MEALHSFSYNQTYFYRPENDPMTLTIRGTTIYRSLLNYGLGFMGAVLNFTWLYNQIAIISVLLGGGAPKVSLHLHFCLSKPLFGCQILKQKLRTGHPSTAQYPKATLSVATGTPSGIKPSGIPSPQPRPISNNTSILNAAPGSRVTSRYSTALHYQRFFMESPRLRYRCPKKRTGRIGIRGSGPGFCSFSCRREGL